MRTGYGLKSLTFLLLALLVPALLASGCGGDSGSSTSTAAAGDATAAATKPGGAEGGQNAAKGRQPEGSDDAAAQEGRAKAGRGQFTPRTHRDSGGGSGQFVTKGGDDSIQEFGGEAEGSEFAAAATALHDYLDARAARAWAAACEHLAGGVSEELAQFAGRGGGGKHPACAELLAELSAGIPASTLREAAVADVGSLRTEGDRGFLLFHGAHGATYFVPMVREGDAWKVAALAPSPLE